MTIAGAPPRTFGLTAFGPGVVAFAVVVGVVEVAAERALQFEALQDRSFLKGVKRPDRPPEARGAFSG